MAQARNPLVQLTKLLPNSANVTLVLPLRFALQANIAPRRVSAQEEIQRERELQKDYQRIWLPPPVKHDPWEEH